MAWIYLIFAGISEIGWPLGFKLSSLSQSRIHKLLWIIVAVVSMAISGYCLYIAQLSIPIGTAYMIWTGIGAIGTFVIGILFFNDHLGFMRLFSAALLVTGLVLLKLSTPT